MLKTSTREARHAARTPSHALPLRVLAFLEQQGLEPTPTHYALAYAALETSNTALSRAIDAITLSGSRITDKQARELSDRFLRSETGGDVAQDAVRHQTLRLADIAAEAVVATGAFNRDVLAELKAFPNEASGVLEKVRVMAARSVRAEKELAAAAREVEVLRQQLDAARTDADRDALTGLANRRGTEKKIRELRQPATVAICDVDRFKDVNDRHGHAVGDRVLKLVAQTLTMTCAPHFIGRWGGEEFVLLFEGVPMERAVALVDEAREQLHQRRIRARKTDQAIGPVTFSAGIAPYSTGDFDDALRVADQCLYSAKSAGRNTVIAANQR